MEVEQEGEGRKERREGIIGPRVEGNRRGGGRIRRDMRGWGTEGGREREEVKVEREREGERESRRGGMKEGGGRRGGERGGRMTESRKRKK